MRLCARNIRRFINDIRILLNDTSDWHAIAFAVFAFEELAKYSELKKAKESGTEGVVMVDERLFGIGKNPHWYKQDIASRLIPQEAMTLIPAGFDPAYFDSGFQTESVEVSPRLRLDCVFVDWRDGQWVHGSPVIPDRIRGFANAILDVLNKLESS